MDIFRRNHGTRCFHTSAITLNASDSSISNTIVANLNLSAIDTTATNCVVTSNIGTVALSTVSNTIFLISNPNNFDTDGSFSYCMAVGSNLLPAGLGNINGPLLPDVLTGTGTSTSDAYYQLADGSPAIGSGLNSADMGAYGGDTPYVLSGVPGIPRITRFVVPATATDTSGLVFEVEAEAFPE